MSVNTFLYVYRRVPGGSLIYHGTMEGEDLTLMEVAEAILETCPLDGYELISISKLPSGIVVA